MNEIQPKKKATPRVRNESSRPATEAKVVDFSDKNSAGTGENMTDKYVESTHKLLIEAYKNAFKVYYINNLDYCDSGLGVLFLVVMQPLDMVMSINIFLGTNMLFLVCIGPNKFWENSREHVLYLIPDERRKSKDIF